MSRDLLHTVTLPILVNADDGTKIGGYGAFPLGTLFRALRVVRPVEIAESPKLHAILGKKKDLYDGLSMLRYAYEGRDAWTLNRAIDLVRPFRPKLPRGVTEQEDWTGENKWEGARWEFASLMSAELQEARLVMWWPVKKARLLSPAIYCGDLSTAAFALSFLSSVRICPRCRMPFVPTQGNDYCTPAHGVAYRTARSRWNAKKRAK